jgi:hypothetical protein
MKNLIVLVFLSCFSRSTFSMPCDAGYICVSKTKKYYIELQYCRYTNSINLETIKIDGTEVVGASLNKGWDGDTLLAFEINLPLKNDSEIKVLTAEMDKKSKKGILRVKYADYQPKKMTVVQTDKISCKNE